MFLMSLVISPLLLTFLKLLWLVEADTGSFSKSLIHLDNKTVTIRAIIGEHFYFYIVIKRIYVYSINV